MKQGPKNDLKFQTGIASFDRFTYIYCYMPQLLFILNALWLHKNIVLHILAHILFSFRSSSKPDGCIIWFSQKYERKLQDNFNIELCVDFSEFWPS